MLQFVVSMPRLTKKQVTHALFCNLLFLLAGCGEREIKPTDPQAVVTGSVTHHGANVTPESSVVFHCKEKNATAAGLVDSLGKFSLKAGTSEIGIPAGRYQVMIRPPELPAPTVGSKEYETFMVNRAKGSGSPNDIPSQIGSLETSGISVEVKVGENNFDFDLDKLLKGASTKSAPAVK